MVALGIIDYLEPIVDIMDLYSILIVLLVGKLFQEMIYERDESNTHIKQLKLSM